MSDSYSPRPEHKFSFGLWTVGNRGRDPFGDVVRPTLAAERRGCARSPKSARGASTCTTTISSRSTPRPRSAIASSGSSSPPASGTTSSCRWRRSICSTTRCSATAHSRRTTRACARTRCRRRCARWISARSSARRFSSCGAAAKAPKPTRAAGQTKRSSGLREAVNYLCQYSIDREVRLPVRARGQAQRAARRHLHGHDRQLSRIHSDARSSGDGGRESRGRARTDGRDSISCTRSRRRGRRASCFTST